MEKGFKKSEGPFVKALDAALGSFHVQRQAYYSGTFVGNHVNSCLKVSLEYTHQKPLRYLLHTCAARAHRHNLWPAEKLQPELVTTAEDISRKFTMLFTLFAGCHNTYSTSKKLSSEDIEHLRK